MMIITGDGVDTSEVSTLPPHGRSCAMELTERRCRSEVVDIGTGVGDDVAMR